MKPTPEQSEALEAFQTGKNLKINAYAGTGKTTSLTLLAANTDRSGTFLAFNKSIADDARKKFTGNVLAKTTHAMAFGVMARRYDTNKMTGNLNGGILARRLNLKDRAVGANVIISARGWGWMICQTIARFMRSDREEIRSSDVPRLETLEELAPGAWEPFALEICQQARDVWTQMINPASDMPMTHDGYLKQWALGKPRIPGEFIFLDEAQDTNGVVLGIIRNQDAQLVFVGDRHQELYAWRGAENAMERFTTPLATRLTKSWRFGNEIAEQGSRVLSMLGEDKPLVGDGNQPGRVGLVEEPDTFLARTNARCIGEVLTELEAGGKPVIVGGVSPLLAFCDGAERLQMGMPSDHEDLIGFANWAAVQKAAGEPGGDDLKQFVNLIDTHGPARLKRCLLALPKEEKEASLIISTGHKAKGREWNKVKVAEDFLRGFVPRDVSKARSKAYVDPSELRLLYVAITRARKEVDIARHLLDAMLQLEASTEPAEAA